MSIKFNGIRNTIVTFKANGAIAENTPVRPSANHTVAPSTSGTAFIGVTINQSKNLVGVQVQGYFELPYSSTVPSVGFTRLAADGNGGVKIDTANGRECAIVFVDEVNKTVGFLI